MTPLSALERALLLDTFEDFCLRQEERIWHALGLDILEDEPTHDEVMERFEVEVRR